MAVNIKSVHEGPRNIPVFHYRLQKHAAVDRALVAAAYRERQRDPAGWNYQGETTWHSRDKLHLRPEYAHLLEIVDAAILARWRAVGWSKKRHSWRICALWANIAGPGESVTEHHHMGHGGSTFSATYYAQATSGSIRLRTPDAFAASYGSTSLTQYKPFDLPRWCELEPKAGDILLFPSWVNHLVTPNRSKRDRIAFTVLYRVGNPHRQKPRDRLHWSTSEQHPDWVALTRRNRPR